MADCGPGAVVVELLLVEPDVAPVVGVVIGGCEPLDGCVIVGLVVFDGAVVVLVEGDVVVGLVCASARAELPSSIAPIMATVLSFVMSGLLYRGPA